MSQKRDELHRVRATADIFRREPYASGKDTLHIDRCPAPPGAQFVVAGISRQSPPRGTRAVMAERPIWRYHLWLMQKDRAVRCRG